MPSRNRVKSYSADAYYHIYNRGVEKRDIFINPDDYKVFINLFKRYLSGSNKQDIFGRGYLDLSEDIELLAYCLMPNHFHILVFQNKEDGITSLMRRVVGSYAMYFNQRYKRVGGLFQDRFKAITIDNDSYYWHISRYIHLNPLDIGEDYMDYPFSSLTYYIDGHSPKWINPDKILDAHNEQGHSYLTFLKDHENYRKTLDEVKLRLAGF